MPKKVYVAKDGKSFVGLKNLSLDKIEINSVIKNLIISQYFTGTTDEKENAFKMLNFLKVRADMESGYYSTNKVSTDFEIKNIDEYKKFELENKNKNKYIDERIFEQNNILNKLIQSANEFNKISSEELEKINLINKIPNNNLSLEAMNNNIMSDNIRYINYVGAAQEFSQLYNSVNCILEKERKVPVILPIESFKETSIVAQSKLTNKTYEKYLEIFESIKKYAETTKFKYEDLPYAFSYAYDNKNYQFKKTNVISLFVTKKSIISQIDSIIEKIKNNIKLLNEYDSEVNYNDYVCKDFTDYLLKKTDDIILDKKDLFYVVAVDKYGKNKKEGLVSVKSVYNRGNSNSFTTTITYDFEKATPFNDFMFKLMCDNYTLDIKGKLYIENKIFKTEELSTSDFIQKLSTKIEKKDLTEMYSKTEFKNESPKKVRRI